VLRLAFAGAGKAAYTAIATGIRIRRYHELARSAGTAQIAPFPNISLFVIHGGGSPSPLQPVSGYSIGTSKVTVLGTKPTAKIKLAWGMVLSRPQRDGRQPHAVLQPAHSEARAAGLDEAVSGILLDLVGEHRQTIRVVPERVDPVRHGSAGDSESDVHGIIGE